MHPLRAIPLLLLTGLLTGCNRYLFFNQAGYEQASFSNEADILFVIDNSASMVEETAALGLNFNRFIATLTSAEGAEPVTETLSDAVDNYISYTQQRGRFLDYNLGIITTSVDYTGGLTDDVDPGEAGLLIGDVIVKGETDVAASFREQLLCDAAYWAGSDLPVDETYECGSGTPTEISETYLDCVCGFGNWQDNPSGAGNEEPLEAALLALCRSVDNPPAICDHDASPYEETEDLRNEGFYRQDGTVVIVVVTDEGDNSRRLASGAGPEEYLDAFASFGKPVKMVVVGPGLTETGSPICVDNVPAWSAERLMEVADTTGGFYRDITVENENGDCVSSNFAQHLTDLGNLLINLVTAFQLQSIPDITTIRVWVDGEEVPQAEPQEIDPENPADADKDPYGPGWSYDSANNAIQFWGEYIPGFNADVEIYYRPLAGKPRDLPF